MNKKTKIGAGISVAGILILIFHLAHTAHSLSEIPEKDPNEVFKNDPVYFMQTDSAGKIDTLLMKDYLNKEE